MSLKISIERALKSGIGAGGIDDTAFAQNLARSEEAVANLRKSYKDDTLPMLHLPEMVDDLPVLCDWADRFSSGTDVVFLGTGGSSLGAQALAQLKIGSRLRAHFPENLDPVTFDALLKSLPLATTYFLATSKSGGTAETLMQIIAVISALDKAGRKIADHLFGISEPARAGKKNGLRDLLASRGCVLLDHDPNLGGRYTVLSNVGLLPALTLGLDAKAIRAGAAEVLAPVLAGKPAKEIPAAMGAALSATAAADGKVIRVLMAYADRLERFTKWWAQLWGESLGKNGKGATPIPSLGPVDQHSQLQLWLDGRADKLFTVITVDIAGKGPRMDAAMAMTAGEPGLAGKTIGDLVAAQGRATADTLAKNGRPVRTIQLATLDERALGGLLMHFMLETVIAAHLIGVNPYDQPAVEEGKILAKKYLAGEK
jgi:glucose-6-phosphate isomerase